MEMPEFVSSLPKILGFALCSMKMFGFEQSLTKKPDFVLLLAESVTLMMRIPDFVALLTKLSVSAVG